MGEFDPKNLFALTLLLRLFRDLSDHPVTESDAEFRREIAVRWAMWRDQEGWTLECPSLSGAFELHLRKDVLGVRFFKESTTEPKVIVRMRILLGGDGLQNSALEFAEDPDAKLIAARLLEQIAYHGALQPLERSMARALQDFMPELSDELIATPQPAQAEPRVIKICTVCGRSFTADAWLRLKYVGVQPDPEEPFEMRDCPCTNTLCLATDSQKEVA